MKKAVAVLKQYRQKNLLKNALALYGVHFSNYVLPFVTIPYLARVLGPVEWGLVAMAQAFGQSTGILIEYGFSLSATREVARMVGDREGMAKLASGILGAKILLGLLTVLFAFFARVAVPALQNRPALLSAGVLLGLSYGFNLLWYFQGLERMGFVATLDVIGKILITAGTFLIVHRPLDSWKVLALQAGVSSLSTAYMIWTASREVPLLWPSWHLITSALVSGWSLFLFRGSLSLYTAMNALVLGYFASPRNVAYYSSAEKLSKAAWLLLWPFTQAIYPRLSRLVHVSPDAATRLARTSFFIMTSGGALLSMGLFLAAPLAIHILYGKDFLPAIVTLRILALLPFLVALTNYFSFQWMLPRGLDHVLNKVTWIAGCVNLCIALVFARSYAQKGMAWAAVSAEASALIMSYVFLRQKRIDPFTIFRHEQEAACKM